MKTPKQRTLSDIRSIKDLRGLADRHENGETFKSIAASEGISASRVSQLVFRYNRIRYNALRSSLMRAVEAMYVAEGVLPRADRGSYREGWWREFGQADVEAWLCHWIRPARSDEGRG